MKLFSEKGYESTSVEEITATAGMAKGTLYYHFSSKEEIFNFLVEEGMKLLKNSMEIKISKCDNTIDKLKAVVLIQLKGIKKYENVLAIVMSQVWGNEPRNVLCKEKVMEYIKMVQNIIDEGIEKGDIKECDSEILACQIFSLACSTMIYRRKSEEFDINKLYQEYEKTLFEKLI